MNIKNNLINFFFPKYCLNCQTINTWLCSDCFSQIKKAKTSCFLCKKTNSTGNICPLCRYYQGEKSNYWLIDQLIWCASYKQGINKKLIFALKYGAVIEIAHILSLLLKEKIENTWGNIEAELLYVPMNISQEKRRSFNQTKLIAQNLAQHKPQLNLNHNLFIKKFKQKQTNKNIKNRWDNLNEFSYDGPSLKNKDLIIVDDLVSSGATLNQIAKCLKPYQVKSIKGAVIFKA
jgi:competence protein ComFC